MLGENEVNIAFKMESFTKDVIFFYKESEFYTTIIAFS